jgi:hypothetical protein
VACTENEVLGDYFVNYQGIPRQGWKFVRGKARVDLVPSRQTVE